MREAVAKERRLATLQATSGEYLDSPVSSDTPRGDDGLRIVKSKLDEFIRRFATEHKPLTNDLGMTNKNALSGVPSGYGGHRVTLSRNVKEAENCDMKRLSVEQVDGKGEGGTSDIAKILDSGSSPNRAEDRFAVPITGSVRNRADCCQGRCGAGPLSL